MRRFLKPLAWPSWSDRHRDAVKRAACALLSCQGTGSRWQRLLGRRAGAYLHDEFYCGPQCLEAALISEISRLRTMTPGALPPNRIPLGLLMVARGKITHIEVRAALEAQRRARHGTIGDWIEKLGFASEQDVTAALALQWGCPIASSFERAPVDFPGGIPLPILEAFQMVPFNYAARSGMLYLAFGARVDHAALYAIERVLECRTQACVAPRRSVTRQLEQMRQRARPSDVEFATRDLSEMARITSSYLMRLRPEHVRLSRIGQFIWLRLTAGASATNLLFGMQANS